MSRLWAGLRHGLPLVGVLAVVVLIGVIAAYIHDSNRRGAAALSDDLITAIDQRVIVQFQSYLAPAEQFLELSGRIAGARSVFEGGAAVESFALHALPRIPAVTGFSYADSEGNFQFMVRNSLGGYDTKTIDRRGGSRRTTWVRRDVAGKVIERGEDPHDTFDPRERPWYKGAVAAQRPFWTDTYLFFTARKPGITLAIPYFEAGELKAVLGVDIELATLCAFLKQLAIGTAGRALVIDQTGRVVAYPSETWLPADRPEVEAPLLDQLGDIVLTRVFNRLRVEGYGRRILDLGDQRVIVSSTPVSLFTDRRWVVLIVVPESDFVGFVAASGWIALAMSVVVVTIVVALAALLAWRNVVAQRQATTALARQQALEARTHTFIDLAHEAAMTGAPTSESLQQLTERVVQDCAAKRAAVWRLSADGRRMVCADCFDGTVNDHIAGLELHRDELPNLFAALATGEAIHTDAADHDPRAAELFAHYLGPLEISNVYVAPVVAGGTLLGMLSVEDSQGGDSGAGLATLCDALASLLALRFAAAATPSPVISEAAATPAAAPEIAESLVKRRTKLESTLLQHNASIDPSGGSWIEQAVVGVVKLPSWMSVAGKPAEVRQRTAMDALVQEVRRVLEESNVGYAALLGDQIVFAAWSPRGRTVAADARLVASAALEIRDLLIKLESRWEAPLDFRVAIDTGAIMLSNVGTDPPSRNLWGGAIGVAKVLAAATPQHTIAASESAYDLLQDAFLFRSRGSYFLPETGTMRTFVLVGRV